MKSLKEIKKELHEYIDSISDEKELAEIFEKALRSLKNDSRKDKTIENDHLANYQQKELDETINHGSSDEIKREKASKRSTARWFNDGGQNAC